MAALAGMLTMGAGGEGLAVRHPPIWVGRKRDATSYTPGTVDSEREARRAVWRGVRRQYPGLSGRQFVKARKEAQRST